MFVYKADPYMFDNIVQFRRLCYKIERVFSILKGSTIYCTKLKHLDMYCTVLENPPVCKT